MISSETEFNKFMDIYFRRESWTLNPPLFPNSNANTTRPTNLSLSLLTILVLVFIIRCHPKYCSVRHGTFLILTNPEQLKLKLGIK